MLQIFWFSRLHTQTLSLSFFPFLSCYGWGPNLSLLGARQPLYHSGALPGFHSIFLCCLITIADESLMEQETGLLVHWGSFYLLMTRKHEWYPITWYKSAKGRYLSYFFSWLMSNENHFSFCDTSLYFSNSFLFSLLILSYNSDCLLESIQFKNGRHFQTLKNKIIFKICFKLWYFIYSRLANMAKYID